MRRACHTDARLARTAILGFACNQGFVFSLFYLGFNQAFPVGHSVFERAELFGTLLFMIVSFTVLRIACPSTRNALLARPLLLGYAALMVTGSLLPFFLADSSIFHTVAECAVLGVPSGFMLAAWGRALGRFPIARSVPEVFIGSALAAAVCFAFACVPFDEAKLALGILPVGSALSLRHLAGAMQDDAPAQSVGASVRKASRLSLKILAGTTVFGLATGFMETYGSDPGMETTPTFPVTLFLFVLFCLAALQLFSVGSSQSAEDQTRFLRFLRGEPSFEESGPLDDSYRLAVLLMMAGFLFVPVLGDFGVPGEAIVLAGYLGLSTVLISLFLVMGHISGRDAAVSFASGFAALFAGEMAGIVFGNVMEIAARSSQTPYIVVACAGLAALFSYLFLFTERDFRDLSMAVRDVDRFGEACARLTREAGLAQREAEILPLALKGRTNERIAQELCIAKSTVDTHLRHIYQKCGVHSRQELIDLGERAESRAGGSVPPSS